MTTLDKQSKESVIVAKSLCNAANLMSIKKKELADILKIDQSTLSRSLKSGIKPKSLKGEVSLMIIRVYRSLAVLSGNNMEFINHFLRTPNKYFKAKPIDLMRSIEGIVKLNAYLDLMKGKH